MCGFGSALRAYKCSYISRHNFTRNEGQRCGAPRKTLHRMRHAVRGSGLIGFTTAPSLARTAPLARRERPEGPPYADGRRVLPPRIRCDGIPVGAGCPTSANAKARRYQRRSDPLAWRAQSRRQQEIRHWTQLMDTSHPARPARCLTQLAIQALRLGGVSITIPVPHEPGTTSMISLVNVRRHLITQVIPVHVTGTHRAAHSVLATGNSGATRAARSKPEFDANGLICHLLK